ncbi:MAG TPA: DUF1361 domain-containing protein [Candidatus Saccharimonadia bacterium]|nr:DUF1361 domain-containing protein [Candidatus Saccharimonadia bacterium]
MQKRRRFSPRERVVICVIELTVLSVVLFVAGAIANRSSQFAYLIWNLFLAWLPLLTTLWLLKMLQTRHWSSWSMLGVTLVWLLLLPNSFYMISDFIHIQDVLRHNLLYDVVMFTTFILTGLLLGFSSLYMIDAELRKRVSLRISSSIIAIILGLCSFAIYLGRDLRWNSWDVLVNPAGILFDLSDHFIHPLQHGDMFTTTGTFFVLLGSLYVVGWQLGEATRQDKGGNLL